jgi:hypothetical protein
MHFRSILVTSFIGTTIEQHDFRGIVVSICAVERSNVFREVLSASAQHPSGANSAAGP